MFSGSYRMPLRANSVKTRILSLSPQRKPCRVVKPVRAAISTADWMEVSYFVGKSIILFTMFYSGLNWLHYKKVREDNEKKK